MIPDEYPTESHRVSLKKKKKRKRKKNTREMMGFYVHNRFSGMHSRTCHFLIGPEDVGYNT
jgi:hypothetical protein